VDPSRIAAEFPAPSYRGAQERALEDVRAAFEAGNDAVLVRAPTGSGKSLIARAIAGCADRPGDGPSGGPVGAYYTTPQVSQLDDVAADPLLEDLAVVRGKSNYRCLLPGETTTPVDRAPCARERGFDCPVRDRCPYFADRDLAAQRPIAAMTLAYFMRTAGSNAFGQRDVVVVDEAHGLAEWAETYATIEIGPDLPVWDARPAPPIDTLGDAVDYAETVAAVADRRLEELRTKAELTPAGAAERDRLADLARELEWFIADASDPESATTWVVDQPDGEGAAVRIKPTNPARYLRHTVWSRGRRFALLSATILDREAFCHSVGLDPDAVALVDVPHTFPVEHRPLYDVTCGKMTYERREETLPELARTVVGVMARHPDAKGLIHAHSYAIADRLTDRLDALGVGERVCTHRRDDRDAALTEWLRADDASAFVSVRMEEALDLEGDLARWQVLCKAPYPNTRDSRVAARLEDGAWDWYYRTTLRTVIQACGRVVRSPEDRGATYLADASLLDLFERARWAMPDWFREQVDGMTRPDLDVDPAGALGGEGARGGSATRRGRSPDRDHPLDDVWG